MNFRIFVTLLFPETYSIGLRFKFTVKEALIVRENGTGIAPGRRPRRQADMEGTRIEADEKEFN